MRSSRLWMRSNRLRGMRSSRLKIRSSRLWMRSSRLWMRSSRLWMRSSRLKIRSSRLWMRYGSNFPRLIRFTHLWKSEFFRLHSQQCQPTLFYLSRQRHRCHNFQCLDSILKFFQGKKYSLAFHLFDMDTDPDPAKRCQSDWIWIRFHNTEIFCAGYTLRRLYRKEYRVMTCQPISILSGYMNAEITANSPSRLYPKIFKLPVRYMY